MNERVEIEAAERFRFDSPFLGLRLWREPQRRMWLEPVIRQGARWGIGNGYPDEVIGYWVKIEGLFPQRLDELLGENTTFGFRFPTSDGMVAGHFESVTWMEGWDQEELTAVICGHVERIRVEHPLAAWWREP